MMPLERWSIFLFIIFLLLISNLVESKTLGEEVEEIQKQEDEVLKTISSQREPRILNEKGNLEELDDALPLNNDDDEEDEDNEEEENDQFLTNTNYFSNTNPYDQSISNTTEEEKNEAVTEEKNSAESPTNLDLSNNFNNNNNNNVIIRDREDPLQNILPKVKFECKGRQEGYYADAEFNCEVFHYCKTNGFRFTFVCPTKSVFNQKQMTCDYDSPVDKVCSEAAKLNGQKYDPNAKLNNDKEENSSAENNFDNSITASNSNIIDTSLVSNFDILSDINSVNANSNINVNNNNNDNNNNNNHKETATYGMRKKNPYNSNVVTSSLNFGTYIENSSNDKNSNSEEGDKKDSTNPTTESYSSENYSNLFPSQIVNYFKEMDYNRNKDILGNTNDDSNKKEFFSPNFYNSIKDNKYLTSTTGTIMKNIETTESPKSTNNYVSKFTYLDANNVNSEKNEENKGNITNSDMSFKPIYSDSISTSTYNPVSSSTTTSSPLNSHSTSSSGTSFDRVFTSFQFPRSSYLRNKTTKPPVSFPSFFSSDGFKPVRKPNSGNNGENLINSDSNKVNKINSNPPYTLSSFSESAPTTSTLSPLIPMTTTPLPPTSTMSNTRYTTPKPRVRTTSLPVIKYDVFTTNKPYKISLTSNNVNSLNTNKYPSSLIHNDYIDSIPFYGKEYQTVSHLPPPSSTAASLSSSSSPPLYHESLSIAFQPIEFTPTKYPSSNNLNHNNNNFNNFNNLNNFNSQMDSNSIHFAQLLKNGNTMNSGNNGFNNNFNTNMNSNAGGGNSNWFSNYSLMTPVSSVAPTLLSTILRPQHSMMNPIYQNIEPVAEEMDKKYSDYFFGLPINTKSNTANFDANLMNSMNSGSASSIENLGYILPKDLTHNDLYAFSSSEKKPTIETSLSSSFPKLSWFRSKPKETQYSSGSSLNPMSGLSLSNFNLNSHLSSNNGLNLNNLNSGLSHLNNLNSLNLNNMNLNSAFSFDSPIVSSPGPAKKKNSFFSSITKFFTSSSSPKPIIYHPPPRLIPDLKFEQTSFSNPSSFLMQTASSSNNLNNLNTNNNNLLTSSSSILNNNNNLFSTYNKMNSNSNLNNNNYNSNSNSNYNNNYNNNNNYNGNRNFNSNFNGYNGNYNSNYLRSNKPESGNTLNNNNNFNTNTHGNSNNGNKNTNNSNNGSNKIATSQSLISSSFSPTPNTNVTLHFPSNWNAIQLHDSLQNLFTKNNNNLNDNNNVKSNELSSMDLKQLLSLFENSPENISKKSSKVSSVSISNNNNNLMTSETKSNDFIPMTSESKHVLQRNKRSLMDIVKKSGSKLKKNYEIGSLPLSTYLSLLSNYDLYDNIHSSSSPTPSILLPPAHFSTSPYRLNYLESPSNMYESFALSSNFYPTTSSSSSLLSSLFPFRFSRSRKNFAAENDLLLGLNSINTNTITPFPNNIKVNPVQFLSPLDVMPMNYNELNDILYIREFVNNYNNYVKMKIQEVNDKNSKKNLSASSSSTNEINSPSNNNNNNNNNNNENNNVNKIELVSLKKPSHKRPPQREKIPKVEVKEDEKKIVYENENDNLNENDSSRHSNNNSEDKNVKRTYNDYILEPKIQAL